MADSAAVAQEATEESHSHKRDSFAALALGAIGVVFGDIGTSPLYAMKEALHHSRSGGAAELAVLGVVAVAFWIFGGDTLRGRFGKNAVLRGKLFRNE